MILKPIKKATDAVDIATPPTDASSGLPFETAMLRSALANFLDTQVQDPVLGSIKVGGYRWGVYAFFDYDDEPIYVGQTKETLRNRIRRHLTNQRTDAVAMNVLDPFEVCSVAVWPLPQFQETVSKDKAAIDCLDALEHKIYHQLLAQSRFKAVLNEKDPPEPRTKVSVPRSIKAKIVTDEVSALRDHPDLRIARRAMTLSRLAQVIAERKVTGGLRRVLLTQAKRLEWLADRRYAHKSGDVGDDG